MQPRYRIIKTALLDQIDNGSLKPGDQVDSENQLAIRYAVSRMTARRAVSELVDEGILARSQGLGTFVSDNRPMSSMLTIRSIREEILSRGHQYSSCVLQLDRVDADSAAARWLGVDSGYVLFYSSIIHMENALPVQLENRWVNPAWAPDYLEQDFSATTANAYLNQVAPLTEADNTIQAVLPDDDTAQALEISASQPCLQIHRRTYSSRGIVSVASLTHPGNRYRLGGHLNFTAPRKERT